MVDSVTTSTLEEKAKNPGIMHRFAVFGTNVAKELGAGTLSIPGYLGDLAALAISGQTTTWGDSMKRGIINSAGWAGEKVGIKGPEVLDETDQGLAVWGERVGVAAGMVAGGAGLIRGGTIVMTKAGAKFAAKEADDVAKAGAKAATSTADDAAKAGARSSAKTRSEKSISELFEEDKIKSATTGSIHTTVAGINALGNLSERYIPFVGSLLLRPAFHAASETVRLGLPVLSVAAVGAAVAHVKTDRKSTEWLTQGANQKLDDTVEILSKTDPELAQKLKEKGPEAIKAIVDLSKVPADMIKTAVEETDRIRGLGLSDKDKKSVVLFAQGKQSQAALEQSDITIPPGAPVATIPTPSVSVGGTAISAAPAVQVKAGNGETAPPAPIETVEGGENFAAGQGASLMVRALGTTRKLKEEANGKFEDMTAAANEKLKQEREKLEQDLRGQKETMLAQMHEKEQQLENSFREKEEALKRKSKEVIEMGKGHMEAGMLGGLTSIFSKAGGKIEEAIKPYTDMMGVDAASAMKVGLYALGGLVLGSLFDNRGGGLLLGLIVGIGMAAYAASEGKDHGAVAPKPEERRADLMLPAPAPS